MINYLIDSTDLKKNDMLYNNGKDIGCILRHFRK